MKCSSSVILILLAAAAASAEPLRLHPDNPHYFLFQGKPTVLVTSGEHYGAVLNAKFDYRKYLDTLARDNLNNTRIFCGTYREVPGSFNITGNTLAPEEPAFMTPFLRTGPQKYDLDSWNDAYFARLRDFVAEAGKRGIVVEVNLFTVYYNEKHWAISPLNAANNVQGIGKVAYNRALSLDEPALFAAQEKLVRKIITELNSFDNIYFEICNEPYIREEATPEWQRRMTDVIVAAERALPSKHLISWNIANNHAEVRDPYAGVSIFNFHYARPPVAVAMNYTLNKPVGMNETGFDGTMDAIYRIQAWDFLLAGGALYNNLDYSFTVGHEDGTFAYPSTQPGGGSVRLRAQLKTLREFMDSLPFVRMAPAENIVRAGVPEGASARVLAQPGRAYGLYLHHGKLLADYQPKYVVGTRRLKAALELDIPAGKYALRWWNPRQGGAAPRSETLTHTGGVLRITSPEYSEDIAVSLLAAQ